MFSPLVAHGDAQHVSWITLHPAPVIMIGLAIVLYIRAVRVLARRGRTVPRTQIVWFGLGMLLIAISQLSILDPLGDRYLLSAHMAQHLLLADIAGPLLLLGVRAPLLYFFWPRPVLVAAARTRVLRTAWRFLTKPAVALTTWLVVLYAWHIPYAYEAALRNEFVHIVEHVTFAFAGILAWWPLLDPTHHRIRGRFWKAIYVVIARTIGGILGIVMIIAQTQFYGFYADRSTHYGISAHTDQQIAGAMMMAVDSVIVMLGFFYFLASVGRDGDDETVVPS